jgi:hypothetical protein
MLQSLKSIVFRENFLNPLAPAGWILLGYLLKIDHGQKIFTNLYSYVNIDDWTEDFDYPIDLDTWKKFRSVI